MLENQNGLICVFRSVVKLQSKHTTSRNETAIQVWYSLSIQTVVEYCENIIAQCEDVWLCIVHCIYLQNSAFIYIFFPFHLHCSMQII